MDQSKMPFHRGDQDALLQWAKNTFSFAEGASEPEDYFDGVLLSLILAELDDSYDSSAIQTGDDRWTVHKKNLQIVYKGLIRLLNREFPGLCRKEMISDFRTVAAKPDPQGICKLLALLFTVAMVGSINERFVPRITRDISDHGALSRLTDIIKRMKKEIEEADEADTVDRTQDIIYEDRDPDLALEEENAALVAQLDKKMKILADMETRLSHLQESYDDLKEDSDRYLRELEGLRLAHSGTGDQVKRTMEAKIREQDDLIATIEAQVEENRVSRERVEHELISLRGRASRADHLEDEVKELRYRAEEMSRKANMAERYKQKLESQNNLQKEIDNLTYEKEQLQRELADYEKVIKRNAALEETHNQYAKRLQDYEMQFIEMDTTRKAEHSEVVHLRDQLMTLESQRKSDEEFIADLQNQINTGTITVGSSTPTSDTQRAGANLEQELENAKEVAPNLSLEISRLKAENHLLRTGMGSGPENARLRQDLEDEREKYRRLRVDYNEVSEKQVTAEAQVASLMQDLPKESNKVFRDLKGQLKTAQEDLKRERELARDLQIRVADRDRDLLSARTDLSAVEKDSVDALEELKSTDKLISASLRDELEALRLEFKNASNSAEEGQRALVKALLEKDTLRKELDLAKEQSSGGDGSKYSEKIKQLRERLQVRSEQLEKAERDKHDLMRKLKASQDGGAAMEQKAQSDQIIRNLQRENALMSTAWYDLSSRLQSNHVVLQRRNDMPRSWLNKQRQMVNATPRK